MTEKKQQHKKKRGKVQHIRGSPKKRKISGKAVFSTESIPRKNACRCEKSDYGQGK